MPRPRSSHRLRAAGSFLPLLLPLGALILVGLVDRGPDGELRLTAFPAALTLFDPIAWDSLVNSLAVAGVVTFGSIVVGVPLARLTSRQRFPGRLPLTILALAPVMLPPLYGALGLNLLAGTAWLRPWSPTRIPLSQPWNAQIGRVWIGLVWIESAVMIPLVALATSRALERIPRSWEDAALASGARPRQIWRDLLWPTVRPVSLRAAGRVFGLVLFEPGGPLALGLRRTLGHQIVTAAISAPSPARAAVLVLTGLAFAMAFWSVIGLRGPAAIPAASGPQDPRRPRWLLVPLLWMLLAGWSVLAWLPTVALLCRSLPFAADGIVAVTQRFLATLVAQKGLGVGVLLALGITTLDLFLAWRWTRPRPDRSHTEPVWVLARWLPVVSPLALALGWLLVPSVMAVAGATFLGAELAPERAPGRLWLIVLGILRLPLAVTVANSVRRRCRPELVEAAVSSGASWDRAWWDLFCPLALPGLLGGMFVLAALTANDVAAAILLLPTTEVATLGLAVLDRFGEPHGIEAAAVTAGISVGWSIVAFCLGWSAGMPLDGTHSERL